MSLLRYLVQQQQQQQQQQQKRLFRHDKILLQQIVDGVVYLFEFDDSFENGMESKERVPKTIGI